MLKLGVPSKGRLMEKTFEWFSARGVQLKRLGNERDYTGHIDGLEGVDLVLMSAGEIPRELAAGRIQYGVTGNDLIEEKIFNWSGKITPLAPMGFGHADLVLAVPESWIDVQKVDDLDGAAALFRDTHGFRLRIATKYHRLTRAFLRQAGVADYQIVDSQGATEGTVANHLAEAIADITSSGATLTANRLRILDDGLFLKSQATLFAAKSVLDQPQDRQKHVAVLSRLGLTPES